MPKDNVLTFECDDPELLKIIKKLRDQKSLHDIMMDSLKKTLVQDMEKGIESTKETVIQEEIHHEPFNYKEWQENRDLVCSDCKATPYFNEKDKSLNIYCTRPNWIGQGKRKGVKGHIRIEECLSQQSWYLNKELKKQHEADSLKVQLSQQNEEMEKLRAEVKKYHDKEVDEKDKRVASMFRGESVLCRLKQLIIPLGQCFQIQQEQAEIPEHLIPPNERCPCGKFRHLEQLEMAKYENDETIPFIDPEIRKHYLNTVQNVT